MISGSLSFTQTEFQTSYKPEIDSILQQHKDATFIIGDAAGADTLALNYLLKEVKIPSVRIVVCPSKPKRDHLKKLGVTIVDGFTHYSKRDEYMTENSDVDIAFIYSLGGGTMKEKVWKFCQFQIYEICKRFEGQWRPLEYSSKFQRSVFFN